MPNYRTSVLKDFSIVRKAFFQVYKDDGFYEVGEAMLNRKFKFKKQFPVQINPNEIKIDYGDAKKIKRDRNDIAAAINYEVPFNQYDNTDSEPAPVNISLKYDIYDEYNARTINGAIPKNEISLHSDKKTTSLDELRVYAGNVKYRIMFIWGEIHIFGFLNNLSITYDAFSCWGEPLKASAEIKIERQILGFNDKNIEIDPFDIRCHATLGTEKNEAKVYTKFEDRAMRAALLANGALR